jgi:hypothetical protein
MPQLIYGPIADSGVPKSTTFQFPSMVHSANILHAGYTPPNLPPQMTAETMLARLPTIVQPVTVDVTPQCATGFEGWLNQNATLAGVLLAFVAAWAWGARRG